LWLAFSVAAHGQTTHAHWEYKGTDGPGNWGHLDSSYTACSEGHAQSPINITHVKTADLPPLTFNYRPTQLDVINNGHSIQVNYAPGSTLTVGDKVYTLQQFHFHHPSEDHVNGHAYDMELHLVHADADKHLAVVAVFLKRGKENSFLKEVWRNMPMEEGKTVTIPGDMINIEEILPKGHKYFTFAGSLTTPPCSENVTWYVLTTPVEISAAQSEKFAKLYPADNRPVQPVNGRSVQVSK
jgi:carbonic anhydrase